MDFARRANIAVDSRLVGLHRFIELPNHVDGLPLVARPEICQISATNLVESGLVFEIAQLVDQTIPTFQQ